MVGKFESICVPLQMVNKISKVMLLYRVAVHIVMCGFACLICSVFKARNLMAGLTGLVVDVH